MVRRIVFTVGALFLGGTLSLVFLEVALRIYNPIIQTIKGNTIALRVNYDQTLYNTNIPGVVPESHIHQNSLGFRGADPPADFAGRLSIISVGGSTTRSRWQSDDRTWTALLGNAVADCFDRIWINNAGFDGHSTFAHIELIRNFITELHPKVVLLLIGVNDLFVDPHHYRIFLKRVVDQLAARSEVVDVGLTLYRSFRAWRVLRQLRIGEEIDTAAAGTDEEIHLDLAKDLQTEYGERLRLIIRLLRDRQTVPVLMTQPVLGGIGRDPSTGRNLSRRGAPLEFSQALEIYNDTMRQVAQNQGVYLIDLARSMPKDTKYYLDVMHYTDAGAEKVAELVASQLLPYLAGTFPSFNNGACQIVSVNPS